MSRIIIELEKEELRLLVEEAVQHVIEKNTREESVPQPEILNVEQVCRMLNMKKSTLYQKTHKSEIPFFKKGKALYFARQNILQWLEEGNSLSRETH